MILLTFFSKILKRNKGKAKKTENDNLPVRVEFYDRENRMIISYSVQGSEEMEKAKKYAKTNNLRIEIIKVN